MAILFTLRVFARNLKKYFLYFVLMTGLGPNNGFTSILRPPQSSPFAVALQKLLKLLKCVWRLFKNEWNGNGVKPYI